MEPGVRPTSRSDGAPPDGDARDRFLDDLRGPLTVIQASAQLLQRRLLRGGGLEPDKLLARLASVERAARAIEARLRELERGDGQAQGQDDAPGPRP